MKKILRMIGIFLVAITCFTSCYSTRVLCGDVKPKEPLVQVNQQWNHHLIAGLVPIGQNKLNAEEYVNGADNYVVKTNFSFLNMLVGWFTCGIYTPTQTKFYIPLRDIQGENTNMNKIKTDGQ